MSTRWARGFWPCIPVGSQRETRWLTQAGVFREPDYIPPKRPYSFVALQQDILSFAAQVLVDGGRLAFWMPAAHQTSLRDENASGSAAGESSNASVGVTAAEEDLLPVHPCLRLRAVSGQRFNKWSRRLVTYQRIPDSEVDAEALAKHAQMMSRLSDDDAVSADDLNPFRKLYFQGFKISEEDGGATGAAKNGSKGK